MTHQQAHRHADSSRSPSQREDDLGPGRESRSAALTAPAHPIESGLLQRKARDANGVSEGADAAVASASSSSGHALPDPLMRKFEGSLGADLSGVRVHTGAESASAAEAVSARAYTIGQDIHFAAGQYDPSSGAGEHLLAHEVAHTVQQRGGTPTRQNKLAVSSTGDAAEHEADRAADAMLAGTSFRVGGADPMIHRSPTESTAGSKPSSYDWELDALGGNKISAPWQGEPVFPEARTPDGTLEGAYRWIEDSLGKSAARDQFTADWRAVQKLYNSVASEMTAHHQQEALIQKLGLLDVSEAEGDLESSVGSTKLPGTNKKIGDAFNADDEVAAHKAYDASKLSRDERIAYDRAKKAMDTATATCASKAGACSTAQRKLEVAGRNLRDAAIDIEISDEERKKEPHLREIEAMKESAELIDKAIDGAGDAVMMENKDVNAAGFGAFKIINTLLWAQKIEEAKGQLAFIDGGIEALKARKREHAVANARAAVADAMQGVLDAHADYEKELRNRQVACQDLATLAGKAAMKSGASASEAENVTVAVQAIPAIEMLVDSATKIAGLPLPSCNKQSAEGCAQATPSTREVMVHRVGDLLETKNYMQKVSQRWSNRLHAVRSMLATSR